MMRHPPAALLGIASLALSACATPVPPVEVTRFHSIAVAGWPPGTLYVVDPRPLADTTCATSGIQPSLEWDSYRTAVERQLRLQGLVPAEGAATITAPLKVRIGFERAERGGLGKRSPVSVGVGGSTGSYGSGVGIGIGINLGGGSRPLQDIRGTDERRVGKECVSKVR